MYRLELLIMASVFACQSYCKPFSDNFNSDLALCSYFGCSTSQEVLPPPKASLLKRPFCNGFRGCANGKRALMVKTQSVSDSDANSPDTLNADKRPFCNGFRGCANGKRSDVLDRDQLWFLQRLLENISKPERRSSPQVSEDGELRRRRRAIKSLLSSRR